MPVSSDPDDSEAVVADAIADGTITLAEVGEIEDDGNADVLAVIALLLIMRKVFSALDRAAFGGTSLEQFRLDIKQKIDNEWNETGSAFSETFDRITATHYNSGRYAQMSKPESAKAFPWWIYDAVIDGRTSAICRGLNGVTKRSTDTFWDTRYPPNHYRCRSSVRSLGPEEGEQRARRGPEEDLSNPPAPGFGSAPSLRPPVTLDSIKLDPGLRELAEEKL